MLWQQRYVYCDKTTGRVDLNVPEVCLWDFTCQLVSFGLGYDLASNKRHVITCTNHDPAHLYAYIRIRLSGIIHWGLMAPYGDIYLDHHWLR